MAFDISTARPEQQQGFDISTAQPEVDFSGPLSVSTQRERTPDEQQQILQLKEELIRSQAGGIFPGVREEQIQEQVQAPGRSARSENLLAAFRQFAPKGTVFARDLPEIGEAPELNQFDLSSIKSSIAASLITNPAELAVALKNNIPGSEVTQDPEGRPVIKFPSGGEFAINKPGLSGQDFAQFLTRLGAFIPAGKITGAGAKQLAIGGAAAAGTETALQSIEALAGGEFSPEQPILAAGLQPLGQVVGEKILSPIARAAGGKISNTAKQIIDDAEETGIDVLTTDLFPPESFFGKSMQQFSEKLGPLGTGSRRAAQQRARIEAVEEMSKSLGLSIDGTPATLNIVESLNKGVAKQIELASQKRGEAIFRLSPLGEVPTGKVQEVIGRQIASQRSLGVSANEQIIKRLENLQSSIKGGNFRMLARLRSDLGDDIAAARRGESLPTKAEAPLQDAWSALSDAMNGFAKRTDRGAAALWLGGNKQFSEVFGKAKVGVLKKIIKTGTAKPEDVALVLKAGKLSDLRRLNSLLDESGRASARTAIVREAIEESGGFSTGFNPDRFLTAIQKPARQRAMQVLFKPKDRKQIDGLVRVLSATNRAQKTGVGTTTGIAELLPLATIGGAGAGLAVNPFVTGLTATSLISATKGYESKVVRNMLLRLANTPKGSLAERKILDRILPGVLAGLQSSRSQRNSDSE